MSRKSRPMVRKMALLGVTTFAVLVTVAQTSSTRLYAERADYERPLSSLWFDAEIPASQQAVAEDAQLTQAIVAVLDSELVQR